MNDVARHTAVISGIGISDIGRRTSTSALDLTEVAAAAAIADAGLTAADIDGIATMGDTQPAEIAPRLGITDPWMPGTDLGRGGLLAPVMSAVEGVDAGEARHVLVYRTVKMMGGSVLPPSDAPPPSPGNRAGTEAAASVMGQMAPLITYHAYSAANWLAMHARRHMYLYGTTKEQLGWLAVNSRRNAGLNERAVYREPITIDDYLAARPVSDPFGLLDCDVPIDGSIAVVVSTAGHESDTPHPVVRVESLGKAPGTGGWDQRPDYPNMASVEAARDLWSHTDLGPGDVDVAELYDGFTYLTFAWLEALGLCGVGEAGPFVEGATRIALDGDLPLNTYGGQLSAGRMHGYWVLHEACVQLRGEAGERQVGTTGTGPGPEVAVVSNGGGPIAGCMLLTH
jgi:acetyl-CoA acetyltransferase